MRNKLRLIVDGGYVRRYHTKPTHAQETVGHHSYLVAWLVALLAGTPSAELLLAALQHDIAEVDTGDLPSPTKRALKLEAQFRGYESAVLAHHGMQDYEAGLTFIEKETLALADRMAGMVLCIHERRLGNVHLQTTYGNFRRYAMEVINRSAWPQARELFELLEDQWEELHE